MDVHSVFEGSSDDDGDDFLLGLGTGALVSSSPSNGANGIGNGGIDRSLDDFSSKVQSIVQKTDWAVGQNLTAILEGNRTRGTREVYNARHVVGVTSFEARKPYVNDVRKADLLCKNIHANPRGCSECTTCHFCRQKTVDAKTRCGCRRFKGLPGGPSRGQWCGMCLSARMGENVNECARLLPVTSVTDKSAQAIACLRYNKGLEFTGELHSEAQRLGYKSAAHYLIFTQLDRGRTYRPDELKPARLRRSTRVVVQKQIELLRDEFPLDAAPLHEMALFGLGTGILEQEEDNDRPAAALDAALPKSMTRRVGSWRSAAPQPAPPPGGGLAQVTGGPRPGALQGGAGQSGMARERNAPGAEPRAQRTLPPSVDVDMQTAIASLPLSGTQGGPVLGGWAPRRYLPAPQQSQGKKHLVPGEEEAGGQGGDDPNPSFAAGPKPPAGVFPHPAPPIQATGPLGINLAQPPPKRGAEGGGAEQHPATSQLPSWLASGLHQGGGASRAKMQ
eukprot:gene30731-35767_t